MSGEKKRNPLEGMAKFLNPSYVAQQKREEEMQKARIATVEAQRIVQESVQVLESPPVPPLPLSGASISGEYATEDLLGNTRGEGQQSPVATSHYGILF